MNPAPVVDYVLTPHALFEMARRGLERETVHAVLSVPEQRWLVRPGRDVLQSRVALGSDGRVYLVRVCVDVGRYPAKVVTAYHTNKIGKYWRPSP